MTSPFQMITHTFRAIWPLPAAHSAAEEKLIESLDRFDRVLVERAERAASRNPMAEVIDGLMNR